MYDDLWVVLIFSISNFFINKNSEGRKLSAEKIPTFGHSALYKLKCDFTKAFETIVQKSMKGKELWLGGFQAHNF